MKKYFFILISLLFLACSNEEWNVAESGLDAGREFIDACLKGNFEKAEFYMLASVENEKALDAIEKKYRNQNRDGRNEYRNASINILAVKELNVNEWEIEFQNSYDKKPGKLKAVKQAEKWLVNLSQSKLPE
ncbi:MAG: hypothetical protein ACOVNR_03325 [Chitinophagaceae bacterium]